jgi:hypothetical protein
MVHPLSTEEIRIVTKGREVRGVKLGGYQHPTRCRFLLGNLNLQRFYSLTPKGLWTFLSRRQIARLPIRDVHHVIQFEIASEDLPGPMKENLILIGDPSQPYEGLNYLEVNLSPVGRSENGKVVLTVGYRTPPHPDRSIPLFEGFHVEIEKRLKALIPFSGGSLRRIFPQENGQSLFPQVGDFDLFFNMADKRRSYPAAPTFPRITTPYRNSFLVGPNVLEWMGIEGKLLAALKGVNLIWEREAKTKKH